MYLNIRFVEQYWASLVLPMTAMGLTVLIGLAVRKVVFGGLRQWAARTESKFDDIVIEAVRGPFVIWVLMLALHLAAQTSSLPIRAQNIAAQVLLVLFIISMTSVFSRLAGVLVKFYAGPLTFTTLTENARSQSEVLRRKNSERDKILSGALSIGRFVVSRWHGCG